MSQVRLQRLLLLLAGSAASFAGHLEGQALSVEEVQQGSFGALDALFGGQLFEVREGERLVEQHCSVEGWAALYEAVQTVVQALVAGSISRTLRRG